MKECFDSGHAKEVPRLISTKIPVISFTCSSIAFRKTPAQPPRFGEYLTCQPRRPLVFSLNDTLLVGLTVHSSLVDELLQCNSDSIESCLLLTSAECIVPLHWSILTKFCMEKLSPRLFEGFSYDSCDLWGFLIVLYSKHVR